MGECWEDTLRAAVEIQMTQQVLAEPGIPSKQSINVAFFSTQSPLPPTRKGN